MRSLLLGAAVLLFGVAPAASQQFTEYGPQASFLTADRTFAGAGAWLGRRFGQRGRISLAALGGAVDDRATLRGELLGHLLLFPRRSTGPGPYLLGGVAGEAGPDDAGYVVLGLGIEWAPGGRRGWALEAGLGGGFRVSLGYRWRALPRGWVPEH